MIGGAAAVLLALGVGACPNEIGHRAVIPLSTYCFHKFHTFDSDDDRVCSATTDGFDCCVWTNQSVIDSFSSECYEHAVPAAGQAHGELPCTDTLATTEIADGQFYQSRNCSDHTPASTTTPPAQPADDSGLSTGAIAGIAVGAVAFVGLIAAAAVCL